MTRQTVMQYYAMSFFVKFGLGCTMAIYMLFLRGHGLGYLEAHTVNMVFYITLALGEIPTGVIADVFGRKHSFVASCMMWAIGMIVYGLSDSMAGFMVAEAIAALGYTMSSGAFDAWLVDRLRYSGFEESVQPIFARQVQLTQFAGIGGAIVGAHAFDVSMYVPWWIGGCIVLAVGLYAMMSMKEEYFVSQHVSFVDGLKDTRRVVRESFAYMRGHRVVRFIVLISFVHYIVVQPLNMQWQPFFDRFVEHRSSLGYVFAMMMVFMACGAWFSVRFLRFVKQEWLVLVWSQILIGVFVLITLLALSLPFALIMFCMHEFSRGLYKPVHSAYLNDHIPSARRATLISFEEMSHHIGGALGLFVSGWLADMYSIDVAWFVFAGVVIVFGVIVLIKK